MFKWVGGWVAVTIENIATSAPNVGIGLRLILAKLRHSCSAWHGIAPIVERLNFITSLFTKNLKPLILTFKPDGAAISEDIFSQFTTNALVTYCCNECLTRDVIDYSIKLSVTLH